MSSGQGWTPPPQAPPTPPPMPPQVPAGRPPRRYGTKGIWLGILASIATTTAATLAAFWAAVRSTTAGSVAAIVLTGISIVPLVLGVVLAAMQGTPTRRGFGLGAVIGWALSPIIIAGVCLVVVLGAYSQLHG